MVGVLALLAIAGYFADRCYAARYGELAIATLEDVLVSGWRAELVALPRRASSR